MDAITETARILSSLRGVWDEEAVDELDHALQSAARAVDDGHSELAHPLGHGAAGGLAEVRAEDATAHQRHRPTLLAEFGGDPQACVDAMIQRHTRDRPLRHEQDFVRFEGSVIDITLKAPIGAAAAGGQVNATRKKFRGTLERAEAGGWQIVWSDEPPVKPGQRVSKKRVPAPLQAMGFTLDECRDVRLAPIVDFKGRAGKAGAAPA